MNINPIQTNLINTNFGCNDSACKDCRVAIMPQQPDTVEISTGKKVKVACKKGFKFVKENKKGIIATGKAALEGLLTACTILGANELMQKVSKANTAPLAGKLAIIGGLAVAGTELIKSRKAFQKTENK